MLSRKRKLRGPKGARKRSYGKLRKRSGAWSARPVEKLNEKLMLSVKKNQSFQRRKLNVWNKKLWRSY